MLQNFSEFEKSISSKICASKTTALVEFKLVKELIGKIEKILKQLTVAINNEKKSKTTDFDEEVLSLHRYMFTGKYESKKPAVKRKAMSGGIVPNKNMARDNLPNSRWGNVNGKNLKTQNLRYVINEQSL